MATETSNIDDLLMSGKTDLQPHAPEHQPDDVSQDTYEVDEPIEASVNEPEQPDTLETDLESEQEAASDNTESQDIDDYGNPKQKSKTYTEEEVNERINKAVRERLARLERNQDQPSQQQVQKQTQSDFEYNPESSDSWQAQLEQFVENTVSKMGEREQQAQQLKKEQQAQAEFEGKFHQGMSKFSDFVDVVSAQPISDAMVVATRGMNDPAAFIYAASKRAPDELNRISRIQDPYAQMVEMGKLEERMRKSKPGTKAPKPIGRTQEDSTIPHKNDKEPTVEDLIARSDAKRRSQINARRR